MENFTGAPPEATAGRLCLIERCLIELCQVELCQVELCQVELRLSSYACSKYF
ncbi:hypothetical protein AB0B30_00350 [Streptomyces narbonensis]|uniref:Uncharacterized protein n=1 Tax=Streptomyces narbonensis TaxID=67333 RepID=A0ABV3C2T8_9ACTN